MTADPLEMKTLSHQQARRVYDRIGARQDSQGFYEDPIVRDLVAHGEFDAAERVFEFGCGTGRLAALLLAEYLPPAARYRGVDLSPTMVRLAQERVALFGTRAEVVLSTGERPLPEPDASCDRWLATFVFDLLSDDEIEGTLAEAHRILVPGGLLCLAGLSSGSGFGARVVAGIWSWVQRVSPGLVGGCRPLDLRAFLLAERWSVVHHAKLEPYCVPTEAFVVRRR